VVQPEGTCASKCSVVGCMRDIKNVKIQCVCAVPSYMFEGAMAQPVSLCVRCIVVCAHCLLYIHLHTHTHTHTHAFLSSIPCDTLAETSIHRQPHAVTRAGVLHGVV
jgi:hypothetical protein